ncbi:glycine cleavage T C-terminal barrel domain-containing protein [Psychromonas sp. KJ10-10]|uniref:glycine cleavage T C-terminal barrel domain-containing protein n=1 Tax=Psychromonas sp. KJ10-10 TaxID=3391823 RepID=UPI0039B4373D
MDANDNEIGIVTSGTYGPTFEKPVAMAYVKVEFATLETEVYALVRGKKLPMTVSKMPFVAQSYYRG